MSAKRDADQKIPRPKSVWGLWIRRIASLIFGTVLFLVIAVGILFIRLKSGPLVLPNAQETAARLVADAVSDFDIRFGDVSLVAAQQGVNVLVQLSDLQVFTKTGQKIAEFPIVRANLDPIRSLRYGVEVESIEIVGAEFRILRDLNGKLNILPPGSENTEVVKPEMIFAAANIAARKPPLQSLRLIDMIDTNLVYIDQVNKRVWRTSKAQLQSTRQSDVINASADVVMGTKDLGDTSVGLHFSYGLGNDFFGFGFKFNQASTVDLADQVPALDWLRSFDAEVTGAINAVVKVDGTLDSLSGVLESDKGHLRGSPAAEPIGFSNIKTYFEYEKETDSLKFTEIKANSAVGSVTGEGAVSLHRGITGAVDALSGSVELTNLEIHPEGIFSQPLTLDRIKANIYTTLSPLTVSLESGEVTAGDLKISIRGSSVAGDKYWNSSYFARFNQIRYDQVMKYWPLLLKDKTRTWIDENILGGVVKNGIAQFHMRNGKPSVDLKFDIEQGKVRYLKTLPILQDVRGRGHLTEKTFKAEVYEAFVIAPNNDRIEVFNSSFYVPNMIIKPATGVVTINAKSSVQAALNMLDEKPFEFLKKADLKPTLAEGQVEASGMLRVPLVKGVKPNEVKFQATALATDVNSTTLVKNRTLTADRLTVVASDALIEIEGAVKLDGIDTQTKWRMPIGINNNKQSEIISDVSLNAENLRRLGVYFDDEAISGSAPAKLNIILQHKQLPRYTLVSEMVGLGVNVSSISWSKPKKSKGNLSVHGHLGDNFKIDGFSVETAGLTTNGSIEFSAGNKFKQANLTELTVGEWLNAAITIDSIGKKRTKIVVHNGTADLRNVRFAKGRKTGAPMDVTLDQLILAEGIVLTEFRADLRNEKGVRGSYSARINGGAEIDGTIFQQENGTAAEVNAQNAGDVLRSANLYSKGVGGNLRLFLVPLEEEGHYQGTFKITKAKVRQDNILAGLLNGISGIGLVQELTGDGIVFENIDGQFTLKPQGVEVRKTSAVGVSIGISMDGNYNSKTKDVNFEGVITPLYALNGTLERVFGKLFGRQRGEGLFSFVYKVKGTSDDPKITVNPLSILAPGVFREIFRTEMPDVGKADIPASAGTGDPEAEDTQNNGNAFTQDADR
jgi:hypothetical protein